MAFVFCLFFFELAKNRSKNGYASLTCTQFISSSCKHANKISRQTQILSWWSGLLCSRGPVTVAAFPQPTYQRYEWHHTDRFVRGTTTAGTASARVCRSTTFTLCRRRIVPWAVQELAIESRGYFVCCLHIHVRMYISNAHIARL